TWPVATVDPSSSREQDEAPRRILWVGRFSKEKRPDWVAQLARDLPQCNFDIVGEANVDSDYGRGVRRKFEMLSNVRSHGYVPHLQMRALYQRADLLLCTSETEGFPTVFLEAWACARPVLSSVDPDDTITGYLLGRVTTTYVSMRN